MEGFGLSWTVDAESQGGSSLRNETSVRTRRRRTRLTIIVAAGAIVFLFLLALLIDATLYIGKVHAGVTVSGVQLGGLTPQEAKTALDLRVEEAQKNQITLASGDKKWTVAPADVGTKVDTTATVRAAWHASRKGNFFVDRFRGFLMYFRDTRDTAPGHGGQRQDGPDHRGCGPSRGRPPRQRRAGVRRVEDQGREGPERPGSRRGEPGLPAHVPAADLTRDRACRAHDSEGPGGPGRRLRPGAAAGDDHDRLAGDDHHRQRLLDARPPSRSSPTWTSPPRPRTESRS